MSLVSVRFPLLVLLALVLFHLCRSPRLRRLVLGAASALFAASFMASPIEALPLVLFLVAAYACIRLVQARPERRWLALSIITLVAAFAYLKRYTLLSGLPGLPFPFVVVGLSYVLFRVLHLLVDAYGGALKERMGPIQFLEYACFFLSWSSGPIQRFEAFDEQLRDSLNTKRMPADAYGAVSRILNGYIKLALVSAFLLHVHREAIGYIPTLGPRLPGMVIYGTAAVAFTLYMYYNFLGYMDIVIGVGRLFGFHLPENFNRPFSSSSFLDFWSRWHITLSDWFKFYVFNPLIKTALHRGGSARMAVWYGVAAYFVTFLVMGIWHGSTPAFVVYGFFLGCGVSGNKLYQELARRFLGKRRYNRLAASPMYRFFCRGLVFAYFATSLTCFWMEPADMTDVIGGRGLLQVLSAFCAIALAASFVTSLAEAARWLRTGISGRLQALVRSDFLRYSYLAAKAYAVALAIAVNAMTVPDILYKVY